MTNALNMNEYEYEVYGAASLYTVCGSQPLPDVK